MTHRDLDVWKKSIVLAKTIYSITKTLPRNEQYNLVSQMNRSAISISSNIAEGASRGSTKDFIRFLNISNGSLSEIETQLILHREIDLYKANPSLEQDIIDIRKMIYRLKQSLSKRN